MKEIKLNKGMVALVDDEDYERISQFQWHVHRRHRTFYARTTRLEGGKTYHYSMHEFILNCEPPLERDHKNGIGLDNRRHNLRVATPQENHRNRGSYKNARSSYKGVFQGTHQVGWTAKISHLGKQIYLGSFKKELTAAQEYDDAARRLHGEFARLNFPD